MPAVRWYVETLDRFRRQYVRYAVEALKFAEVCTVPGASGGTCATSYLQYQREFGEGGGLIVLEVGFQGCFASIKLHTMTSHQYMAVLGVEQPGASSPYHNRLFAQDCAKFKDFLHINSFSYDFNLAVLTEILHAQTLPYPSFNLCDSFRQLLETYSIMPKFCHGHIARHEFDLVTLLGPDAVGPNTVHAVLSYLSRDASVYGCHVLLQENLQRVLYVMMDVQPRKTPLRVVALFFPDSPEQQAHTHALVCYLLQCDLQHKYPRMTIALPSSGKHTVEDMMVLRQKLGFSAIFGPSLFEEPEAPFDEVIAPLMAKIQETIAITYSHHERDSLWAKLVSDAPITLAELQRICRLVSVQPFEHTDPALAPLLGLPFSWDALQATLHARFAQACRPLK